MGWISNLLNKADLSVVHTGLDIVGMTPLFGNVADLANSVIYAAKGDMKNAGLSLTAAIPGAGQAVIGTKLATQGAKALKADDIAKATKATKEATEKTAEAKKALDATKAAKAKLSAEASRTPGLGFPSKSKLTKEAQENLATKGGVLKQARASQQQARTAKTAADKKANRKITLKERRDIYADRVRSGNALTSKIGGGNLGFKGANVLLATKSFDPEGLQPKSPNEEPEKKPELPKDDGDDTAPLINNDLRDKPDSKPQGDGLDIGEGIIKAVDTITTEIEAGVEEGKSRVEKAKKEQQDNYTKRAVITAEMDDLMTQDPDYFRKNRGAANVMFQKARELGVTADQFNSYVRNNKTSAEARRRDIDRAEAKQFLTDKLNQSVLEPLGSLTSRQKGENTRAYLESLGISKVTPEQASSLMNRGTALRQAKKDNEKKKPKTTSRTA